LREARWIAARRQQHRQPRPRDRDHREDAQRDRRPVHEAARVALGGIGLLAQRAHQQPARDGDREHGDGAGADRQRGAAGLDRQPLRAHQRGGAVDGEQVREPQDGPRRHLEQLRHEHAGFVHCGS